MRCRVLPKLLSTLRFGRKVLLHAAALSCRPVYVLESHLLNFDVLSRTLWQTNLKIL